MHAILLTGRSDLSIETGGTTVNTLSRALDEDSANVGLLAESAQCRPHSPDGYVNVSPRELRALCRGFVNATLAHAAAGHDIVLKGDREVDTVRVMGSVFE